MKHLIQKRFAGLVLLLLLTLACGAALAQEAQDVTARCSLTCSNAKSKLRYILDDDYTTVWSSLGGYKKAYLEVTAPAGETLGGVWVRWDDKPVHWQVQVEADGAWETAAESQTGFLSDYLALPEGTTRFRMAPAHGVPSRMRITELRVLSAGENPAWVQTWQPQAEKADLLVLVAHPDDEVLFMGGAIPYYAGEMGKTVEVAYLVPSMPYRRLELLDGLWLCGVRNYPDLGPMSDVFADTVKKMYKRWSKNKVYSYVTELYRRYQPDVVMTHDVNGEYGHGAHKVACDAAVACLKRAADPKVDAKSKKAWGLWDVPKLYVHLYDENVVDMDWRVPLDAFQGKTAFDMAEEAFRCHRSQQKTRYVVEDYGPYDNSLFGLYRSLVGPDESKDDFFEHITQAE